jgi:hypothetical protein
MAILKFLMSSEQAKQTITLELDRTPCEMSFRFCNRVGAWILGIRLPVTGKSIQGIPMRLGVNLLEKFRHLGVPLGNLFIINTSNPTQECGRYDLGKTCFLVYDELLGD